MKLSLLAAIILLVGCTQQQAKEEVPFAVLPEGLKDCKFYYLDEGGFAGVRMRVIRCPNSSVSTYYKDGKVEKRITTIEGQ